MDILFLSVAQLLLGFVLVCAFILFTVFVIFFVREALGLNKQPVEHMYDFNVDRAELRTGGWQYYNEFFNKMEEFRSDFA